MLKNTFKYGVYRYVHFIINYKSVIVDQNQFLLTFNVKHDNINVVWVFEYTPPIIIKLDILIIYLKFRSSSAFIYTDMLTIFSLNKYC